MAADILPERVTRMTAREQRRILAASEDGQGRLSERRQENLLGAPVENFRESEAFYKGGRVGLRSDGT
jgi:hypothetical protein